VYRFTSFLTYPLRPQQIKEIEDEDSDEALAVIDNLLIPLERGIACNWEVSNRREAGIALSFIAGYGKPAHEVVQRFSKVVKKVCRMMWGYGHLVEP